MEKRNWHTSLTERLRVLAKSQYIKKPVFVWTHALQIPTSIWTLWIHINDHSCSTYIVFHIQLFTAVLQKCRDIPLGGDHGSPERKREVWILACKCHGLTHSPVHCSTSQWVWKQCCRENKCSVVRFSSVIFSISINIFLQRQHYIIKTWSMSCTHIL